MPVPVSVTNPNGAGLSAANVTELVTEGPFARLKAVAREEAQQVAQAPTATHPEPALSRSAEEPSTSGCAVETNNLSFTYTGIGEHDRLGAPLHSAVQARTPLVHQVHLFCVHLLPYADGRAANVAPIVHNMSVQLPKGATCLLIGPNGAGKTTLLKVRASPCA